MKHIYEVDLSWDNERKGTLSSRGLNDKIEVATPPEFPKGMKGIWSPEHLFVASVSSCLMTTFLAIAENSRLIYSDLKVKAQGELEKVDGKYMITKITLYPVVIIEQEKQVEKAERILQKSEAACLISNSILTDITMTPKVVVVEPVV